MVHYSCDHFHQPLTALGNGIAALSRNSIAFPRQRSVKEMYFKSYISVPWSFGLRGTPINSYYGNQRLIPSPVWGIFSVSVWDRCQLNI